MLAIGMLFNIVERGSVSYNRIEKLLNEPIEIDDKANAIAEIPSGDLVAFILIPLHSRG